MASITAQRVRPQHRRRAVIALAAASLAAACLAAVAAPTADANAASVYDGNRFAPLEPASIAAGDDYLIAVVSCLDSEAVFGSIDWNLDGVLDAAESTGPMPCGDGITQLAWTVPDDIAYGDTFVRVSVEDPTATVPEMPPAPDDYPLTLVAPQGQGTDTDPETPTAPPTTPTQTQPPVEPTPVDTAPVEPAPAESAAPELAPATTPASPAAPTSTAADTTVTLGNVITYTVVVTHAPGATQLADDMGAALAGATWNGDASTSAGVVTYDSATGRLSWSGSLVTGAATTVTYSVTTTGSAGR